MPKEDKGQASTPGNTLNQVGKMRNCISFIPGWIPANMITLLRVLFLIPIYLVYLSGHPLGVFIRFLLAWLTDIVDGMHARYRHQTSQMGKWLDPAVDKLFVLGLLWMLAPGRLSGYVIGVTLGLELVIVLLTLLISPISKRWLKRQVKIGASMWGKIKMFLQGCGLTVLILGLDIKALQHFSEVLFWTAAVFSLVSIIFYVKSMESTKDRQELSSH